MSLRGDSQQRWADRGKRRWKCLRRSRKKKKGVFRDLPLTSIAFPAIFCSGATLLLFFVFAAFLAKGGDASVAPSDLVEPFSVCVLDRGVFASEEEAGGWLEEFLALAERDVRWEDA